MSKEKSERVKIREAFVRMGSSCLAHSGVSDQMAVYKDMVAPPKVQLAAKSRRKVNQFKVGADPEFVMELSGKDIPDGGGSRMPASDYGLRTGLAFGADMNGRLVELRPKAYRSTLRVTASILDTLRWMAIMRPDLRKGVKWLCGAYQHRDGLGGHVHFGRKRPTRAEEVAALDQVFQLFVNTGVFPKKEIEYRQSSTPYGKPGDMRLQLHGYEYRTFPSWLGSPWHAFLVMTVSKLAVYRPELVAGWKNQGMGHLKNLLGFYKGQDDDAALALEVLLRHGLPDLLRASGDFRGAWGITEYTNTEPPAEIRALPPSIDPSKEAVQDVLEALLRQEVPPARMLKPTWSPTAPPKGYKMLLDGHDTRAQYGVGEIFWDAVISKDAPLHFTPGSGKHLLKVSRTMERQMVPGWEKRLKEICPAGFVGTMGSDYDYQISIGEYYRQGPRTAISRKVVYSGLLPVWRLRDVHEDSLAEWKAQAPARSEKKAATARPSSLLVSID